MDYPEGPRNRLTALVRIFLAIPILLLISLLSGGGGGGDRGDARRDIDGGPAGAYMPFGGMRWFGQSGYSMPFGMPGYGMMPGYNLMGPGMMPGFAPGAPAPTDPPPPAATSAGRARGAAATGGGIVVIPTVLMLLFRRKYPRWWFDWNREISRFGARVGAYVLLLRDEYPSTDEEKAVHLDVDYPDARALNRWLPLVKWFLTIPHYIVLALLVIGVVLVTLVAWLAILVTGRYPRGLYDYTVGVGRWCSCVSGYAFLLVTDKYPPFSNAVGSDAAGAEDARERVQSG